MNLDAIIAHKIKTSIKKPKQVGSVVFVHNGAGELVETHKTIDLGKAFFSMSNDSFFEAYGFNFVPEGLYWERSKRAAEKNVNAILRPTLRSIGGVSWMKGQL